VAESHPKEGVGLIEDEEVEGAAIDGAVPGEAVVDATGGADEHVAP
jgi:hypothetical protein